MPTLRNPPVTSRPLKRLVNTLAAERSIYVKGPGIADREGIVSNLVCPTPAAIVTATLLTDRAPALESLDTCSSTEHIRAIDPPSTTSRTSAGN